MVRQHLHLDGGLKTGDQLPFEALGAETSFSEVISHLPPNKAGSHTPGTDHSRVRLIRPSTDRL